VSHLEMISVRRAMVNGGQREHRRHPQRIDVQQDPVTSRPNARAPALGRAGRHVRDEAAADRRGHEQHGNQQRPLPRNTVAKKRSSRSPIRSLSTPMNHRTRFRRTG
jgi:hypothetical protein